MWLPRLSGRVVFSGLPRGVPPLAMTRRRAVFLSDLLFLSDRPTGLTLGVTLSVEQPAYRPYAFSEATGLPTLRLGLCINHARHCEPS